MMEMFVNLRPFMDELAMEPVDIIEGDEEKVEELKSAIFAGIESQFDEQSKQDYERDFFVDADKAKYEFGALSRQEILNRGNVWNEEIRAEFRRTVVELLGQTVIPLDDTMTYEAKKALRELDNDWFPMGRHSVLDTTWTHTFETILTSAQMDDIEANPEFWGIITVRVS